MSTAITSQSSPDIALAINDSMVNMAFEGFGENFSRFSYRYDIAISAVALFRDVPVESDETVKVTEENGMTKIYRKKSISTSEEGSTSAHVMTDDNENLKTKAIRAENAVTDLIDSVVNKTISIVKNKTEDLAKSGALEPGKLVAKNDAAAIGKLGPRVTDLATVFEETLTNIEDHPYDVQVRLLIGYKKLIEEQINVIDSQIHLAKRLR